MSARTTTVARAGPRAGGGDRSASVTPTLARCESLPSVAHGDRWQGFADLRQPRAHLARSGTCSRERSPSRARAVDEPPPRPANAADASDFLVLALDRLVGLAGSAGPRLGLALPGPALPGPALPRAVAAGPGGGGVCGRPRPARRPPAPRPGWPPRRRRPRRG